jgi:hypothetical protein
MRSEESAGPAELRAYGPLESQEQPPEYLAKNFRIYKFALRLVGRYFESAVRLEDWPTHYWGARSGKAVKRSAPV